MSNDSNIDTIISGAEGLSDSIPESKELAAMASEISALRNNPDVSDAEIIHLRELLTQVQDDLNRAGIANLTQEIKVKTQEIDNNQRLRNPNIITLKTRLFDQPFKDKLSSHLSPTSKNVHEAIKQVVGSSSDDARLPLLTREELETLAEDILTPEDLVEANREITISSKLIPPVRALLNRKVENGELSEVVRNAKVQNRVVEDELQKLQNLHAIVNNEKATKIDETHAEFAHTKQIFTRWVNDSEHELSQLLKNNPLEDLPDNAQTDLAAFYRAIRNVVNNEYGFWEYDYQETLETLSKIQNIDFSSLRIYDPKDYKGTLQNEKLTEVQTILERVFNTTIIQTYKEKLENYKSDANSFFGTFVSNLEALGPTQRQLLLEIYKNVKGENINLGYIESTYKTNLDIDNFIAIAQRLEKFVRQELGSSIANYLNERETAAKSLETEFANIFSADTTDRNAIFALRTLAENTYALGQKSEAERKYNEMITELETLQTQKSQAIQDANLDQRISELMSAIESIREGALQHRNIRINTSQDTGNLNLTASEAADLGYALPEGATPDKNGLYAIPATALVPRDQIILDHKGYVALRINLDKDFDKAMSPEILNTLTLQELDDLTGTFEYLSNAMPVINKNDPEYSKLTSKANALKKIYELQIQNLEINNELQNGRLSNEQAQNLLVINQSNLDTANSDIEKLRQAISTIQNSNTEQISQIEANYELQRQEAEKQLQEFNLYKKLLLSIPGGNELTKDLVVINGTDSAQFLNSSMRRFADGDISRFKINGQEVKFEDIPTTEITDGTMLTFTTQTGSNKYIIVQKNADSYTGYELKLDESEYSPEFIHSFLGDDRKAVLDKIVNANREFKTIETSKKIANVNSQYAYEAIKEDLVIERNGQESVIVIPDTLLPTESLRYKQLSIQRNYDENEPTIILGRELTEDKREGVFFLQGPKEAKGNIVSKEHAKLMRGKDGTLAIQDLGSTNKTYMLSDQEFKPLDPSRAYLLKEGSIIRFGDRPDRDLEYVVRGGYLIPITKDPGEVLEIGYIKSVRQKLFEAVEVKKKDLLIESQNTEIAEKTNQVNRLATQISKVRGFLGQFRKGRIGSNAEDIIQNISSALE